MKIENLEENIEEILKIPNEVIGILIKLLLTLRLEDLEKINDNLKHFHNAQILDSVARIIKDLGEKENEI